MTISAPFPDDVAVDSDWVRALVSALIVSALGIPLSSTRELQLDKEERVPCFIAHHVQLHKIIPLCPFLYLALITSSTLQIFDVDL
jgi:hypothetical protein